MRSKLEKLVSRATTVLTPKTLSCFKEEIQNG